ncbi:hypothetical protein OO006_11500 [Prosthecochloris sp. SCSIO W1101]|uniref:ABC transporter substrate-binding protein n=1 Tax=Prosthecochloris sp. SCSIO W1101 TaxID=2992242 RepID=UPI00223E6FD4|nr:hypothetical protein [Prosthecochloris sp. SCSIO W1101]UZJ40967.1 hypothetical protein OO006_11500 [Prosthecochloris sp. SCSIO W1101]
MQKYFSLSLLQRIALVCGFVTIMATRGDLCAQVAPQQQQGSDKTTFTVITPPDPNFIPMSVLKAKADEWMTGVDVELVMAPSGDPSAMRAMLFSRAADFALFSVLGGSRFSESGISGLSLVGVHVWKGVHLLAQESVENLEDLDGKRLIAVPAIMTPSHMVTNHALRMQGIHADFVSGGGGPVLMAQLSRPENAPLGFVAPEPMVSIILERQKKENWPVRYKVLLDSQAAASPETGETPLGGLWVVNPERVGNTRDAARKFIKGFRTAVDYVNNPEHIDEVAKLVSQAMKEVYGQQAPASVYRSMLQSGRLRLDFRQADEIEGVIRSELKKIYDVTVDKKVFRSEL